MLCPICSVQLYGNGTLCSCHGAAQGEGWAAENRIWCDYFHRGKEITRIDDFQIEETVVPDFSDYDG